MRTRDLRHQQTFERVRDFGAARRDVFPASSAAGKLFAAVARAGDDLDQQFSGGDVDPAGGSATAAAARQALRERLTVIATMAKALALDTPGLDEKFRARLQCSDARLLYIARGFARDARPLAKLFIAHDMPSNFLAALQEAIDALVAAMQQRAARRDKSISARVATDATIEKGRRAVRQLDAIVRTKLQGDRASLALWAGARRATSARAKPGVPAVTPPAAEAAAPAAPGTPAASPAATAAA